MNCDQVQTVLAFMDMLKSYSYFLFEWLKAYGVMLIGVSVASFIVSILFCTLVIAYLPSDYFLPNRRTSRIKHPVLRIGLKCLKNLLAVVLVVVGIIQIPLPGQGVLTILIGIIISDMPGKRKLERRIISAPVVLATANGIRSRFKRPLLVLDESIE
ncbi:hypothetical protein C6500_04530 [Candidatus Poribacteria bacterium]|nr:MAG: hypothetical protein C6500_04530 [Candidatus Poribacteria bacterium]